MQFQHIGSIAITRIGTIVSFTVAAVSQLNDDTGRNQRAADPPWVGYRAPGSKGVATCPVMWGMRASVGMLLFALAYGDSDGQAAHISTDASTRYGAHRDALVNLFGDQLKEDKAALVQFFAPWCPHCKKFAPEYKKVSNAVKVRMYDARILNSSLASPVLCLYPACTLRYRHQHT